MVVRAKTFGMRIDSSLRAAVPVEFIHGLERARELLRGEFGEMIIYVLLN